MTTAKPESRKAPAKPAADPIFAAIAEYQATTKEWVRLSDELKTAETEAEKEHGKRPVQYIWWKTLNIFDEYDLNTTRNEWIKHPAFDPKSIEREYEDIKARLRAAYYQGVAWDHRTGTKSRRESVETASFLVGRAADRLARTKPTTLAGAAALINHVQSNTPSGDWEIAAMKMLARTLVKMEKLAA